MSGTRSIDVYNSQTWTVMEEAQLKLWSFEMSCLWKIPGVSKKDRKRSADIEDELVIKENIVDKIQMKRLRYFEHNRQMEQRRLPYVCLHARTQVQRDRQTHREWERERERRRETTEKTGLIEKDCLDLNVNYNSSYKSNRTQNEVEEIVVTACKSIVTTLNIMHKGIVSCPCALFESWTTISLYSFVITHNSHVVYS